MSHNDPVEQEYRDRHRPSLIIDPHEPERFDEAPVEARVSPEVLNKCVTGLLADAAKPAEPETPRAMFIRGLREIADLYDANPTMPIPGCVQTILAYTDDKETLATFARIVGHARKTYSGQHLTVSRQFGSIELQAYISREKVCRKVVTTKIAPAEVERVIPATPERVVESVEWVCDEPLLAATK